MNKNTLKSEFLKFFSYHWSLFGLLAATIIPPIALVLSFYTSSKTGSTIESFIAHCLRFLYLGQTGIVIAMSGYIGQEYSHCTLRATLLAQPSRLKLLLSKEIVVVISTLISAILSNLLCFIIVTAKAGFSQAMDSTAVRIGFSQTMDPSFVIPYLTHIVPTFISWVFLGLISGNLAIITESLIVPIAIMFSMILRFSQMILAISGLAKYLPDLAVMNLFSTENQTVFLEPQIGIAIQFIWLVFICLISANCFKKRDIR